MSSTLSTSTPTTLTHPKTEVFQPILITEQEHTKCQTEMEIWITECIHCAKKEKSTNFQSFNGELLKRKMIDIIFTKHHTTDSKEKFKKVLAFIDRYKTIHLNIPQAEKEKLYKYPPTHLLHLFPSQTVKTFARDFINDAHQVFPDSPTLPMMWAATFNNISFFDTVYKDYSQAHAREQKKIKPLIQHLLCTICASTFKSPHTTPCGHTFCEDCILKTYNSLPDFGMERQGLCPCPLCRKNFNVYNLMPNVTLQEIVDENWNLINNDHAEMTKFMVSLYSLIKETDIASSTVYEYISYWIRDEDLIVLIELFFLSTLESPTHDQRKRFLGFFQEFLNLVAINDVPFWTLEEIIDIILKPTKPMTDTQIIQTIMDELSYFFTEKELYTLQRLFTRLAHDTR